MLLKRNDKIVFFGDSLTQRTGILHSPDPILRYSLDYAGSYVDFLLKKLIVHYPELEVEAINKGVGGNTTEDLLNRADTDVLSINPDWVVLFIGQNDSFKYGPPVFEEKLDQLLGILKNGGIQVLQLSTTPNIHYKDKCSILNEYDVIIKTMCKKYGNYFVDIKTPFNRIIQYNETAKNPIAIFNQGSHLSELGNILLADLVFDTLTGRNLQ